MRASRLVVTGMLVVAAGLPASADEAQAFANYPAPASFPHAHRAGETSIGVNPRTNTAMFLMTLDTARVRWDDSKSPPAATWTNVSFVLTSRTTLDPILWTDRTTGRTFVAQLAGEASLAAFTDDDGETWIPTQPPSAAPAFDHETIGGGPYAAPLSSPAYPNALYYCAHIGAIACARSDTGGLTWGPPLIMIGSSCVGLHGHIVVDGRGTVYVPHGSCPPDGPPPTPRQGVIVSEDNGLRWQRRVVPGMPARSDTVVVDPSVAIDGAGRLYFATVSEGRPVVATSEDGGRHWSAPVDTGAAFGIRNAVFPMTAAGDPGRAAFAFYGTTVDGNDQEPDFNGVWHLYVAMTTDAGATWTTTDVTPDDPVQRGCIQLVRNDGNADMCSKRNLYDFQGMTVDAEGRVLIGYADGCTGACARPGGVRGQSTDSLGTIARQTSGKRLYAAFDAV